MDRRKLKCGGSKKRRKALFGTDGAITAAATLAAAGITAVATEKAAKEQAKAMIDGAKTQAQSIKEQTTNNNNLQKENIAFTRQENQANRQQQQDIQTTLQLLAGQQNMNDRMEANKMQVKYGGKPKRKSLSKTPFYGGANGTFKVTDGGGVIPIQVDQNGYGLYELYGNDHEHTHKAPGGKRKTGVGIKFNDGSVVEGEGNQNTNQGELMYVTPNDAVFISKHSIGGFNPTDAVKNGVHPLQAYNIQENIKNVKGLNDDGSRKRANLGGLNNLYNIANLTQLPSNNTGNVANGIAYAINDKSNSPVAKCGKRISLKRRKADLGSSWNNYWNNYGGATMNAAGNLGAAGFNIFGNMFAANRMGKAYEQAGNILADTYRGLHGIDMSEVSRNDFAAPHTMAVVHTANTNINPQLERVRRNANAETREVNRGTMSSAARQQRIAGINDRARQREDELYAYKDNQDEQTKQRTAKSITQTASANADRDVQANKDYRALRQSLLQYNNDIENSKILGIGQSLADARTQSSLVRAQGLQSSMSALGSALTASGQGFATRFDAINKDRTDFTNTYIGLGNEDKVQAAILRYKQTGDKSFIEGLLNGNTISIKDRNTLNSVLKGTRFSINNSNFNITPGNILPNYNNYGSNVSFG